MAIRTLTKIGLVLGAVIILPWLFLRTLEDTIATPYEIDSVSVSGWTLVLSDPTRPDVAVLGLRPPALFRASLFDQLFDRTMASMTSPVDELLPIVLRSELRGELASVLSPDELMEVARQAGLDRIRLEPVCMAVKRQPFSGRTREFFFVLFEAPEVTGFRRSLTERAADRGVSTLFDNLDLILPIAGSDPAFESWWPVVVDRTVDCQAPVAY